MISLSIYSSTQSVNCTRTQASLVYAIFHHYFFNSIYITLPARCVILKFICNLMLPRKPSCAGRSDASTDFVSSLLSDRSGSPTPYYVTRSALARLRSLALPATGRHLTSTLFRINRTRDIHGETLPHLARAGAHYVKLIAVICCIK